MHSRWILRSLALLAVLTLALPVAALAQTSRVEGMALQGDYIKDYTGIYTYTSEVPNVGNLIYGELGTLSDPNNPAIDNSNPLTLDRSMGAVLGNLWDGRFGTWAIHLREESAALGQGDASGQPNPGLGGIDPNHNANEAIDLMWGKKSGTTSFGLRLFREYHVLPVTGSDKVAQTRAALGAMLATSSPGDPDYTTPWRDATVTSVRVDGDTTTVDLHGVPAAPPSGAGAARIAVQQLVWTVTAVSGKPAVRVLLDGRTVPALWGVEGLDEPLTRAPRTDVQAPIWLIDPQQAAPVGHTFAANLTGTVPDGVAGLRVLRGSTVVSDQRVQLTASAPQQGDGHVELTLDPGTYTVVAYVPGPAGGADRDSDSHEITVR